MSKDEYYTAEDIGNIIREAQDSGLMDKLIPQFEQDYKDWRIKNGYDNEH